MNQTKLFRIAGILLLFQVISFAVGFNAFLRPLWEGDFLANIGNNRSSYITGMLLEFIAAPCFIAYTAIFLPYFKKLNKPVAYWYFGLRVVEFAIVIISTVCLLSLYSLSEKYGADPASAHAVGDALYWARDWSMVLLLFVFAINSFGFAYFLYATKLIPRVLTYLLLLAATILFVGQIAKFYGTDLKDAVILPIVIWEMITAIWLIVKGGSIQDE